MIEFVVTVRDPNRCCRWNILDGEHPDGAYNAFLEANGDEWDIHNGSFEQNAPRTVFFNDEINALSYATNVLRVRPNCEVIISKSFTLLSAAPVQVIKKTITEKGILPT